MILESLQKYVSLTLKSISPSILVFSLAATTEACSSKRGMVNVLIGGSLVLPITKLTLTCPRVTARKYGSTCVTERFGTRHDESRTIAMDCHGLRNLQRARPSLPLLEHVVR